MAPFEFYRASQILDYSKVFLRDLNQAWYQRGLTNIGDDAHAVGDYVQNSPALQKYISSEIRWEDLPHYSSAQ